MLGIFDRDIFLIIVKGLGPFRHFTIIKNNISRSNVPYFASLARSHPKLDALREVRVRMRED